MLHGTINGIDNLQEDLVFCFNEISLIRSSPINIEADDKLYHLYMDGNVYSDVKKLEHLFDEILEKTADFSRQNAITFEEHD